MRLRAMRYELDPNQQQASYLRQCCGFARYVYNWGLAERQRRFKERDGNDRFISFFDQCKDWIAHRDAEAEWARDLPSGIALCALQNLDRAFANFRRRLAEGKRGKEVGHPKFKGRHNSTPAFQMAGGAIKPRGAGVYIPKLGVVRSKEAIVVCGAAKTVTISRSPTGRWYASVLYETDEQDAPPPVAPDIIGIDLGISHFATLSTGEVFDLPREYRETLKRRRRLQRRLSRRVGPVLMVCEPGANPKKIKRQPSHRWCDAKGDVAALDERIADLRRDALHKLTTDLARRGAHYVIEDLNAAGMRQNGKLARALIDAPFGEFVRQLTYKCLWYGSTVQVVSRWFPSTQTCSACGYRREGADKLPLSQRVFECPQCGLRLDRDLNAARTLAGEASTARTAETDARGLDGSAGAATPRVQLARMKRESEPAAQAAG